MVHIDLGIAFEQGRFLNTPELVPFRLTRDIVDGMGATGVLSNPLHHYRAALLIASNKVSSGPFWFLSQSHYVDGIDVLGYHSGFCH